MSDLRLALALCLLAASPAAAQDTPPDGGGTDAADEPPPPDGGSGTTSTGTTSTGTGTTTSTGTSTGTGTTTTSSGTSAGTGGSSAGTGTTRSTTSSTSAGPGGARSTATITRGGTTGATAGTGTTPAAEEEEEEEGDGRDVDFLWIEIEGGISDANLIAFTDSNFVSAATGGEPVFREVRGTGPFIGAGLGFRVYFLAIGARFYYANYQSFDLGNIGGDITLRLPIPVVEPYARVGFGYGWQGQANYMNPSMSTTTVYGWSFDSALGVDIYLANWFTIGAGVGLNVLNMSRQSDPTMPCMAVTDICPGNPGDAVGYQLRGFAQIGFRF